IVRRTEAEGLKPTGVPLRPLPQISVSLFVGKPHCFTERFKVHLIPVPSPVEPEKQEHWSTDNMGQSHRSGRKPGFTAQEITDNSVIVLHHTIPHHADHSTLIETFFHLQHRIRLTDLDDRLSCGGVQLLNKITNQRRILLVHENSDLDVPAGESHRTDHFE